MPLENLYIERCDGLKHIVTIAGDDDANYTSILPKLEHLGAINCKQLEYVLGEYHQNHTSNLKIDIHAPALETLDLERLSNMVSICSTRYYLKCPSLEVYWFGYCPQFLITSITDFMIHSDARQLGRIIIKGLETSNTEWLSAFGTAQCLLKQSLSNVKVIELPDCPQLISVFTMSHITTMLLEELSIIKCDGLKHIITDVGDNNDQKNNSYALQKLKNVDIHHCNQLECVFGQSHEDNSSYEDHNSNLEIYIHLPALEHLKLENLPNMTSICTEKYHATCPSLKEFDYKDCPRFAKTSTIDFIEHSNATQVKCNQVDSKELLEKYKKELHTEEDKFSPNVSPNITESKETEQESVQEDSKLEKQLTKASSSHPEINDLASEQPMSQQNFMGQGEHGETKTTKQVSLITNIPPNDSIKETMKQSVQKIPASEKEKMLTSQSTKESIQDLVSTKAEIGTPPCPSSELGDSVPNQLFLSLPKSSSQELIENEEVDFQGLFKIDSRRASLLDEAFAKYPHLREWQKSVRPKFCKWRYESLSDMLVFLKEKTPKALLNESCKEEFEKIYAELESFRFDKNWLASIHQKVMNLQVDNEKLKHLMELETHLNNVRAEIARIKNDVSKCEIAFDF